MNEGLRCWLAGLVVPRVEAVAGAHWSRGPSRPRAARPCPRRGRERATGVAQNHTEMSASRSPASPRCAALAEITWYSSMDLAYG